MTIVRGRTGHLANLLTGLERQADPPSELVVVRMGGPELGPTLRHYRGESVLVDLDISDGTPLPLAAARNRGAVEATGDSLIFLDVDCIPGASLVGSLARRIEAAGTVASSQVQYLPPGVPHPHWSEVDLRRTGRFHPVRPALEADGELVPELLWSLAFAISRPDFAAVGGFDEGYVGYGAEDTDLGLRAQAAGLRLLMVADAMAYHQHHVVHDPPLQHFDDVVVNARRFRRRWGRWPMEGWLAAMADLGLLHWGPGCAELTVLRRPTPAELEDAYTEPVVPVA